MCERAAYSSTQLAYFRNHVAKQARVSVVTEAQVETRDALEGTVTSSERRLDYRLLS
jgi:hypothetical protein